jgi:hypothetical protein
VFSRKFHPPYRNGDIVQAEWDDCTQEIIIRMAAFKHFKEHTTGKAFRRIMELINHETLHGVIMGVQWKDKVPFEDIGESEFVLQHGFDPHATAILKKSRVCTDCESKKKK